jgi:hypothetical protein
MQMKLGVASCACARERYHWLESSEKVLVASLGAT